MATTTIPQVSFRTIDGVRGRYADSGGPRQPTVVLTSPWPESVYAFAPMRTSLSEHARVFAVDLPGFGASAAGRRETAGRSQAHGTAGARYSSCPTPVVACIMVTAVTYALLITPAVRS